MCPGATPRRQASPHRATPSRLRLKAFGERIAARDPGRQTAEIHIALMNRFNALGAAVLQPLSSLVMAALRSATCLNTRKAALRVSSEALYPNSRTCSKKA